MFKCCGQLVEDRETTMPENHSRVGCRADSYAISDAPHTKYWDDGVPILVNTPDGNIVRKYIDESTLTCTECGVEGYYDDDEDPLCPNCGLILSSADVPRTSTGAPLLVDAKSAGRIDKSSIA